MPSCTRSGSILLMCMAITAALVGVAFLYLRSMQMQNDASRTTRQAVLARRANDYGVAHALREILKSYDTAYSKSGATINATAPGEAWMQTFLPFSPFDRNAAADLDDTRAEDGLTDPFLEWEHFSRSISYRSGACYGGWAYLWPRGRWIEPGFATSKRFTDTTLTPDTPAEAIFLDAQLRPLSGGSRSTARYRLRYANAVQDLEGCILANPAPEYDYRRLWSLERNAALMSGTDSIDLTQAPGTNATTNPNDPKWPDPNLLTGLSAQEAWMQSVRRHAPAFFNLLQGAMGNGGGSTVDPIPGHGASGAARGEHVWLGRGYATNVARLPDTQWGALPCTFSSMYRRPIVEKCTHGVTRYNWRMSGFSISPWSDYPSNILPMHNNIDSDMCGACSNTQSQSGVVYPTGRKAQNPLGGDVFAFNSGSAFSTAWFSHNWLGPQFSAKQWRLATEGYTEEEDQGIHIGSQLMLSPYGHGVWTDATLPAKSSVNSAAWTANNYDTLYRDLRGPVDTPWRVNLLTAPPRVVHAMIMGMMPRTAFRYDYTSESYKYDNNADAARTEMKDWTVLSGASYVKYTQAIDEPYIFPMARHLYVPYVAKAFADAGYANPVASRLGETDDDRQFGHQPNFHWDDPKITLSSLKRPNAAYAPDLVYPGRFVAGTYLTADQGQDDCGELIKIGDETPNKAPYSPISDLPNADTGKIAWRFFDPDVLKSASDLTWTESGWESVRGGRPDPPDNPDNKTIKWDDSAVVGPPAGDDGREHTAVWKATDNRPKVELSYAWDLANATAFAIAIAQAQWAVVDGNIVTASTFTADLAPADYDTIAKIDALFLKQLGENIDASGTPRPPDDKQAWTYSSLNDDGNGDHKYKKDLKPSHNILTLTPGYTAGDTRGTDSGKFLLAKNLTKFPKHHDGKDVTTLDASPATGPVWFAYQRSRTMERQLNDWRMSLFGSSPQYYQTFKPYDFNGDGVVECTAFPKTTGKVPAVTAAWLPATLDGHILTKAEVDAGTWRSTCNWFCLTGTFVFTKSNFYRVMTRAELYDNILGKAVASTIRETIFQVDANRDVWTSTGKGSGDATDSQILYQRWHHDWSRAGLPSSYP